MSIRPQAEFPLWDEYAKHFELNENVIFALYPDIYTNNKLTPDLLVHESTHLRQQQKIGVNEWVKNFLENPSKRIEYELEAYRNQIKSIKDREQKNKCRIWASETLSSGLYGNIISKEQVFKLLSY
jgi:hypothetical protein